MASRTSLSSPGSEGLTLQRNGRGSTPSARSNRTPMQIGSCERDSAEESLDGQTSAMCRQRTLDGELASNARPSSLVVSPASRSVVPGSEKARKITVTSGRRCLESCGSSGPLGCLERMLLESSIWNSNLVVLTWKVKVIPSGRSLFQLAGSEPCIDGIEYFLLPTPTAPGSHQVGTIQEWGGSGNRFRLLTTPKADDGRRGRPFRGDRAPGDGLTNLDKGDGSLIGCRLNPEWIESLMGLPTGWTDCDASGTRLSRNRCTQFLRGLHKLRTVYRSR